MSAVAVRVRPTRTIDSTSILIRDRVRPVMEDALPELVASICDLGLIYPIVIDEHDVLVDGLQRLAALSQLGVTDIPVIIQAATDCDADIDRLRHELAANGVRTNFTPVQAAAARRRLRDLAERTIHHRNGIPLAERRKNWTSELATKETGVSRSTMDRVDKIFTIAEDAARPLIVRRAAAEGLTRIDIDHLPVDRVLREVQLVAEATAALERYPALVSVPGEGAQLNMARHLDSLPEGERAAQLESIAALWSRSADAVAAYECLRDTSRIEDLLEAGNRAAAAARSLRETESLTADMRQAWGAYAHQMAELARNLSDAITEGTPE
ncbi:ParB/RepB/Spo0J family partition protein [Microbacterium sp. 77mftsu3.1]|uniref:ParB/RepB/Spo0J family partition protein n=1 Tax=Microbacterium sp. 77mftsu3.1 TaxID=1761802 RepID=UPI00088C9E3B|nr:ParB/RepB/Spo0J family partition protein [Microbacterium sp. 77mftsu3.1]SDH50797.1 ParB-like nuclease domain-containing protein [Microbacterium sp. 77mftsu3.1]